MLRPQRPAWLAALPQEIPTFDLVSDFAPTGDPAQAIDKLVQYWSAAFSARRSSASPGPASTALSIGVNSRQSGRRSHGSEKRGGSQRP